VSDRVFSLLALASHFCLPKGLAKIMKSGVGETEERAFNFAYSNSWLGVI